MEQQYCQASEEVITGLTQRAKAIIPRRWLIKRVQIPRDTPTAWETQWEEIASRRCAQEAKMSDGRSRPKTCLTNAGEA